MMVVRGGEGGVERGGGSSCAPVHSSKYFSSDHEVKHPD